MDKEKETRELTAIIAVNAMLDVKQSYVLSNKLIAEGYRKADEVRKETIKDILDMLRYHGQAYTILQIKRKYGIEAENS